MKKNTKTIVFLAAGAIVIWMIFRRKPVDTTQAAVDLAYKASSGAIAALGGFDTRVGGKTTYGID